MNDQTRTTRPWILKHLDRWARLYEILGVFLALLISYLALRDSRVGLRIQNAEFAIRNRPYLVIARPRFDAEGSTTDGRKYPHTVRVDLINVVDIPATSVRSVGTAFLNGEVVFQTISENQLVTKDDPREAAVHLREEVYSMATNSTCTFEVEFLITYAGMLQESTNAYRTKIREIYQDGRFRPMTSDME